MSFATGDTFPQWINLVGSPPQEDYLENRICAQWRGPCPYCKVEACLVGYIPCIAGQQVGVPCKVGDGVVIRATPLNSDKICEIVCVLTRVRSHYMRGRPILVGGTLAAPNLGEEMDLDRGTVVLADFQIMHPVPLCKEWQQAEMQFTVAAIKRSIMERCQ